MGRLRDTSWFEPRQSARWSRKGPARAARSLFRRDDGDLHEQPRVGEFGFDTAAAGQILPAGPGVPGLVHRLAVADVANPDGGADDLGLVGAAQRQQAIDLLENLLRLALGVLLRIVCGDPGGEHETVG